MEDLPDPKRRLREVLCDATELPQRRRRKFSLANAVSRLAQLIDDFGPLRRLPAFADLEGEVSARRTYGEKHRRPAKRRDAPTGGEAGTARLRAGAGTL